MSNSAWYDVTQETIQNCFIKAGFLLSINECVQVEDNDSTQIWSEFCEISHLNMQINEFIDADNDVITCDVQSLDQIKKELHYKSTL